MSIFLENLELVFGTKMVDKIRQCNALSNKAIDIDTMLLSSAALKLNNYDMTPIGGSMKYILA